MSDYDKCDLCSEKCNIKIEPINNFTSCSRCDKGCIFTHNKTYKLCDLNTHKNDLRLTNIDLSNGCIKGIILGWL